MRNDWPAEDASTPAVWFAYSPSRKGDHPQRHLRAFHGILHADGYAGFNKVYDEGRVHDAACSAHVRRKFYAIQQAHAFPLAAEALMRIGSLYVIKAEVRRRTSDEHRAVRQERARPLLDSMRAWL